jgi:hypothetical protein
MGLRLVIAEFSAVLVGDSRLKLCGKLEESRPLFLGSF